MKVTIRTQFYVNELKRRREAMLREIDSFIDACESMDVDEVAYAIVDLNHAFEHFRKTGVQLVKVANS